MKTKQLIQNEIEKITNMVKNLLNMYLPQVTILQEYDHQVIWLEKKSGIVNEWNNIVCSIAINSSKSNFKKLMDFQILQVF